MNDLCPEKNLTWIYREKNKCLSPKAMPDTSFEWYVGKSKFVYRYEVFPHIIRITKKRLGSKECSECCKKQKIVKNCFFIYIVFVSRDDYIIAQLSLHFLDQKSQPSLLRL